MSEELFSFEQVRELKLENAGLRSRNLELDEKLVKAETLIARLETKLSERGTHHPPILEILQTDRTREDAYIAVKMIAGACGDSKFDAFGVGGDEDVSMDYDIFCRWAESAHRVLEARDQYLRARGKS